MLERVLQRGKIADAVLLDHDFPVDQCGIGVQVRQRIRYRLEFVGPVECLAGEQLHLATVEARLQAIAVEFRFMHIRRIIRRLVVQRRKLGRDESGQRAAFRGPAGLLAQYFGACQLRARFRFRRLFPLAPLIPA